MTTLKKLKKDRLSIISKILKKDEDFIPISPEFIKDLRDKILLENSALKFSISDYKLMCKNDKVLNMMAVALKKPKAKLKKFCKYMSVFEENISKSSKSIANKINGPITKLPVEIRSAILDKFAEILPSKYVLLDWIDKDKLNWEKLSKNPNAIDLLEENYDKIDWEYLSENPNATELLTNNQDKLDWDWLSVNPNAIKLLTNNQDKISWKFLSSNPNAIKLLTNNQDKIDWENLSSNPNAIKLLTNNQDKIHWFWLSLNPNAIDLIGERIKDENTLTTKQYNNLQLFEKINWGMLSKNPNAIELLTNNQDKISWFGLSENPNAINLIKERIKYESTLTPKQYNNLTMFEKIHWESLSVNPNAIDLLKENQDKIDWFELSLNPAIFKAI